MNARIIAQQFNIGKIVGVKPYGSGRINETYLVETAAAERYVLQRLHRIFSPALLPDMEAVIDHLRKKKIQTPQLIKTRAGERGVVTEGACWRMQTFIPGKTLECNISPEQAESAASLVGAFHAALCDFDYAFKHTMRGFHDTPAIMKKLEMVASEEEHTEKRANLAPLIKKTINGYGKISAGRTRQPERVVHGDLKINNIRFDVTGRAAVSLLDFDTLGRGSIFIDFGDAVRSWCNTAGEDDAEHIQFNLDIFNAMVRGYFQTAKFLTGAEREAIPRGAETVMLELSARFLTDAFEESYFALDARRYKNLFEQNKALAEVQLKLHDDFLKKKSAIKDIVRAR